MVVKLIIRARDIENGDDVTQQSITDAVVNQFNTEMDSVYGEIPVPDEVVVVVTIVSSKNQ
jgi:hypothetical protein